MDPTTTLITFMLQTLPTVRSVQLVGSWDNFNKHYDMERDIRRARGQWRGCYAFDNIIYDGDGSGSPIRKGGLKMGHTYWYYYKIDGDIETHDTSLPSTTSCPIFPGQEVNFLSIPVEESPARDRSASVGCATEPLKTLNPDAKYETPRPPPPTPKLTRFNTSPGYESFKSRSNHFDSPKSSRSPWSPRTLFGPKTPSSASPSKGRGITCDGDANISYPVLVSRTDVGRQCVSLHDMKEKQSYPESRNQSIKHRSSNLKLNLEALELDDDDDANFARPSMDTYNRDSDLQATCLSPAPPSRDGSQRSQSSSHEHAPTLRLLTAVQRPEVDRMSKPLPRAPLCEAKFSSLNSSLRSESLNSAQPENSRFPLRIQVPKNPCWEPRSHFSIDSLDEVGEDTSDESSMYDSLDNTESDIPYSSLTSPTASLCSDGCASPSSFKYCYGDESHMPSDFNLSAHPEPGSTQTKSGSPTRSEFQYNPIITEVTSRGFQGYSLPDSTEYGSDLSLKRRGFTIVGEDGEGAGKLRHDRATFGGSVSSIDGSLLADLAYLGEAISS